MTDEKQCPLKVAAKGIMDDTACKPDCAWYIPEIKMCAIKVIAKAGR
jgi:hypothetical protein